MKARLWTVVAGIYLTACLLLGGASAAGAIVNALLQAMAVVLIVALLWRRGGGAPLPREARTLAMLAGAWLLLILLSLVPLPPAFWEGLPFRDAIARGFGMLGIGDAWIPLSLAPRATLASLLFLLPPAAMFLLVLQLSPEQRRSLAPVVLVVAAISIGLGAFQLIGGPSSSLRFYEVTNPTSPVGFFANVNHQATLLLCALPLTGFMAARAVSKRSGRSVRSGGTIISVSTALFLIVGLALAGSVAGYGLLLPAAAASLLIYRRAAFGRIGTKWKAATAVLLVLFLALATAGPLGRETLAGKFSEQPTSRRVIAGTTLKAIADSFPVGTGLGTFTSVYRRYEDPSQARRQFVNRAHNDYLEATLELGLPGLLLILGFIIWWARRSIAVWMNDFNGAGLARAGSVMIGLVLLHSVVDYPVRTSAVAALFAMACAFMTTYSPPLPRRKAEPTNSEDAPLRHLQAD